MTVVIIAGSIAPYSNRLYNAYGQRHDEPLHVLTCTDLEPHRQWDMPAAQHYQLESLQGLKYHASYTSHIYFNPAVLKRLRQLKPSLILICDFSPTMILAGLYARLTGTALGILTDGVLMTDPGSRSFIHRIMRKLTIPFAKVGIGASPSSIDFLKQYGLADKKAFIVPIVTNWDAPQTTPSFEERPYDLLFCGTIDEDTKGACFFADVVAFCHKKKPDLKVRIVGDGVLRSTLEKRFHDAGISARFDGFLQADKLPEAYSSAKLFLFPSKGDAWGLVANESVLGGTPILVSPFAASGTDLVKKFKVGIQAPLDVEQWGDTALDLLSSPKQWQSFHKNRPKAIDWFSLPKSVSQLDKAIRSVQQQPIRP